MKTAVVSVRSNFDIRYTAMFFAGLAQHAKITFQTDDTLLADSIFLCELCGAKFAIDLWDHADQYDHKALDWCDLYLKRSLKAPQEKVLPFGLNFIGREWHSSLTAARFRGDLRLALDLFRRPTSSTYEKPPDQPKENAVLLQTRLWEEEECPGDFAINERRIQLVEALKVGLGDRFRGGLIDNSLARRMAPHLISKNPTRQRDYISWQKTCRVGIYTRGLFGSVGFKLAEYLASSKCIVAEPILTILPTPLENGIHLVEFREPRECIELCKELLASKTDLAHNAWSYYRNHVRHAADAIRMISAACG